MQRLYYLANDVDTSERVSEAIHHEGIRDWNFHVLSKDEAGLYIHHVHSATPFQQLDLFHSAARWGIGGGAIGLAAGLLCLELQVLPWQTNALTVTILTLLGVFYGAWQGGMVGMRRENYKVAPFHDDIEAGRYLIMIDVRREHSAGVHELMQAKFPNVLRCGSTRESLHKLRVRVGIGMALLREARRRQYSGVLPRCATKKQRHSGPTRRAAV